MRVNEYFISLQGEGPESGRRALFIRFSGCNLSCRWCDSKYALHLYTEITIGDIVAMAHRTHCKYIVLTGGEPTIQEYFKDLLETLSANGFQVDVETNGTNLPGKYIHNVRYIVSPKDLDVAENWLSSRVDDYVFKFVVDIDQMDKLFDWVKARTSKPCWFMPLTTNIKGKPDCMIDEMVTTGRIVQSEMIKRGIDGYLCTRLQNLYRVR